MSEIERRIERLKTAHRDLDQDIAAITADPDHDQLLVARLKKRKLMVKDEIAALEDQMIPDIIA